MCGIYGIFDRSGKAIDVRLMERMNNVIRHRGPDGDGQFIEREIGLGHRRLSIIDVSGGGQPIGNEDGSIQVVFNGEIYNYIELRRELLDAGHEFKTQSDTEVIVHAYEQWGPACVSRFNGMFAFALWDAKNRDLFFARDHLGIKPMYYTWVGDSLVFASEIKALLCHPECRREVDLSALAELFTFRFVPSPKTLFEGIFKLPPAHWLKVSAKEFRIERFWNWVPQIRAKWDETALVEEYQSLVDDAVRLQLRSDVPLGLFLSSGVDSAALLAIMAGYSRTPVQAFTIAFAGGEKSNEEAGAHRMATRFGADHHVEMVSAEDYANYFERYMGDLEEPVGHESAGAFYFVARLGRRHVKVSLTGQGVDEPWAGYDRYIGIRYAEIYSRLPPIVTERLAPMFMRVPGRMEKFKRGLASLGERDILTRFARVYSFFNADMKEHLYKGAFNEKFGGDAFGSRKALLRLQSDVQHLDPLTQMLYIDTRASLPDDLLMVADKTSMANSLEVRVPFLDYRVIEFIESLPPQLKLRNFTGKYLHKKAMLKWLPREMVYQKKKGFSIPLGQWLRTSLRPFVEEALLSRDSHVARYFDTNYMARILEDDRQGRENYTRHIFLLLSLELWHRSFLSHGGAFNGVERSPETILS